MPMLNMTDHANIKYDGPCQYDRPCKQEMILRHCKYNIEIKHFFIISITWLNFEPSFSS